MAVKKEMKVVENTTDKIEVLDKVFFVNGAFYRTEAEAQLSLLKADMYMTYLKRAYPGCAESTKNSIASCMAAAQKNNFANTYVYVDDVIKLLAEKGVSFTSGE